MEMWTGCKPRGRSALHVVPPITELVGRSWRQPNRARIVIDDAYAYMTRSAFEDLAEYSHSMPTGVYDGKMWRSQYATRRGGPFVLFYLHWYAPSTKGDPSMCSTMTREVVFV
jgi:hypothetical protein